MKITQSLATWLCFVGSLLILINVLAIAFTGSSIMITSGPISIENISSTRNSWYRISFGVNYLLEGFQTFMWLILASLNFSLASSIVLTHERPKSVTLIFIFSFSLILFLTGGGFIIGSILALLGSLFLLQRERIAEENFISNILKSLRLDLSFFRDAKGRENLRSQAIFIVILVSFLAGLGSGIYIYNAYRIMHSTDDAIRILLFGEIFFDIPMFSLAVINIGLGVIKWMMLSIIIYIIGSRILQINVRFDNVSSLIAYAMVPLGLQIFLPVVFSNEPMLTVNWPTALILITNLWATLALILAVKECFNVGISKALGMVLFAGPLYWLLTYKILLPALFGSAPPGIFINIGSNELVLMIVSISFVISYMLGTFKRY